MNRALCVACEKRRFVLHYGSCDMGLRWRKSVIGRIQDPGFGVSSRPQEEAVSNFAEVLRENAKFFA